MTDESTVAFFERMLKEISKNRLNKYCNGANVKLDLNLKEDNRDVYGEEMSIIMLWGHIGSVVLKTHYTMQGAKALAAIGMNKPASEIPSKVARDFLREYSNMQAGYIRGLFEKYSVLLGMSLPFSAKGEDEVIFKKIRDPRSQVSKWSLQFGTFALTGSSEVFLPDPATIESIRNQLEKEVLEDSISTENDGDVQFI